MAHIINVRCTDVKKSKRTGEKSLYTDKAEVEDIWKVSLKSDSLKGFYIDLCFQTEAEARRFAEGKTYTPVQIAQILIS